MKAKLYPQFFYIISFIFCFFCTVALCRAVSNDIKPLKNIQKEGCVVGDIDIYIKKSAEDASVYLKMATDLIVIKKNRVFNKKQLKESLDSLKLCNKFSEVDVKIEEKSHKIKLKFYLTPFKYIQNINISGCAPFFEKDILKIMSVYVGDVFFKKKIEEQTVLIENFYKKEGFYSPYVEIDWDQDPLSENYTVFVNIKKGQYEKLKNLNFHGNCYFSDFRLKIKIFHILRYTGSAGRFIENNFKKDIKKLQQLYLKKKFYEVEIDYKFKKKAGGKTVEIDVYIKEGPRYIIEFKGNEKFKDRKIEKELVLKTVGNLHKSGIFKSIKNIQKKYREAGYLGIKIRTREFLSDFKNYKEKKLVFEIVEGPLSIISGIEILGNKIFTEKKIKEQILSKEEVFSGVWAYNPDLIDEDIYAIKSLYLKNGLCDVNIWKKEYWDKNRLKVKLVVNISEGSQVLIKSIKICGDIKKFGGKIGEELHHKIGKPLQKYMIKSDENTLSAIISEKGYPHVKVSCNITMDNKGASAHLVYKIDQGPFVKMGKVYYSGNFRTKEKTLSDSIGIKEGEPFSLIKMFRGQKNIRNLGLFNSVRFKTIGLKEQKETITVFVHVEEKKACFLQFGSGFESNRGLFLETSAGDHNFLSTGKDFKIASEISQIGYKGELEFKNPGLFVSNLSADLNLFLEKKEEFNQSFGIHEHGVSLGFRLKSEKKITAGMDFGFKQKDTYKRDDVYENMDDAVLYEKRRVITVAPLIGYDTRDSFIRPRKGTYLFFTTKFSKGLDNSLDDFIKYRFDGRYFLKLSERIILAGIIRAGYVDSYGAIDRVPDDELFFLGGSGDIRGYKENMFEYNESGDAAGGRFSGQASVEGRIYLGYNVELTIFYDAGKLSCLSNEIEEGEGELRSSSGLGLRYITPIGPVGIMWGYKLDRRVEEAPDRWHFSMGYSF